MFEEALLIKRKTQEKNLQRTKQIKKQRMQNRKRLSKRKTEMLYTTPPGDGGGDIETATANKKQKQIKPSLKRKVTHDTDKHLNKQKKIEKINRKRRHKNDEGVGSMRGGGGRGRGGQPEAAEKNCNS